MKFIVGSQGELHVCECREARMLISPAWTESRTANFTSSIEGLVHVQHCCIKIIISPQSEVARLMFE